MTVGKGKILTSGLSDVLLFWRTFFASLRLCLQPVTQISLESKADVLLRPEIVQKQLAGLATGLSPSTMICVGHFTLPRWALLPCSHLCCFSQTCCRLTMSLWHCCELVLSLFWFVLLLLLLSNSAGKEHDEMFSVFLEAGILFCAQAEQKREHTEDLHAIPSPSSYNQEGEIGCILMSCLFQKLLDELNTMFMPLKLKNNSVLTLLEGSWLLNRRTSAKND